MAKISSTSEKKLSGYWPAIGVFSIVIVGIIYVGDFLKSDPPDKCDCANALDAAMSATVMTGASRYKDLKRHNKETAKMLDKCDSWYDAREYMNINCPDNGKFKSFDFEN
jgi:hypothetical protein